MLGQPLEPKFKLVASSPKIVLKTKLNRVAHGFNKWGGYRNPYPPRPRVQASSVNY